MSLFVGKAESLFNANLDDPQERTRFLRYLPHAFKLYKYAKDLLSCDRCIFRKFEWEGWILSQIGSDIQFRDNLKFFSEGSKGKKVGVHRKKIELMINTKNTLFENFKEKEDDAAFQWFKEIVEKNPNVTQYVMGALYDALFKKALEDIKNEIQILPSVFILYGSWSDEHHASLVKSLSKYLSQVCSVYFDMYIRAGGVSIYQHVDKIFTADKVILIGSPGLREQYDEGERNIVREINILRERIYKQGAKGIIPVLFTGSIDNSFPTIFYHLLCRNLNRKTLVDLEYFANFFKLLIDICHTEENGAVITEIIQNNRKKFERQVEALTLDDLKVYLEEKRK